MDEHQSPDDRCDGLVDRESNPHAAGTGFESWRQCYQSNLMGQTTSPQELDFGLLQEKCLECKHVNPIKSGNMVNLIHVTNAPRWVMSL